MYRRRIKYGRIYFYSGRFDKDVHVSDMVEHSVDYDGTFRVQFHRG